MFPTETLNFWLALGAVILQGVTVGLFVLYFLRARPVLSGIVGILNTWGFQIALAASLAAFALTLFYSEIIGFPPCPLCWWQRVFLYPQVVIFALALFRGQKSIAEYSIILSLIGFGIAIYHHALQILPAGSLPCPAEGEVSCAQRFVFEFGYITLPLMAATVFAFLIALMLFAREKDKMIFLSR